MATRNRARRIEAATSSALGREAVGVGLGVLALLIGLALISYEPLGRSNLVGPFGAALADVLVQAMGLAAFVVPLGVLGWAVAVFSGVAPEIGPLRGTSIFAALLASAVAVHLAIGSWNGLEAGGMIGGFLSAVLSDGLGRTGAWLVVTATLLLLVAAVSGRTPGALGRSAGGVALRAGRSGADLARRRVGRRLHRGTGGDGDWRGEDETCDDADDAPILLRRSHVIREDSGRGAARPVEGRRAPVVIATPPEPSSKPSVRRQVEMPFQDGRAWCLPDAQLLDPAVNREHEVDHETLNASARVLEAKLATFDVRGEVVIIHPGPVITTYEFEPAAGIRVNRIVALADDLAMAMRAMSVRILAPIPGKSVVGIEVANARRDSVPLREIVLSDAFLQLSSPLALALGKDTTGRPFAGDLARMPHLLVAGATGSGKSVFLNTLIISLLMRASPRDVRIVMIDPKILELAPYHQIPHLLVPVITEAKQAFVVLVNLVLEMNNRYRTMRDKGVRNLEAYNRAVAAEQGEREVIELDDGDAEEGEASEAAVSEGRPEKVVHRHLPRIVVIIDELADLIMTRREVEDPITKLAQKARACGIHLVVATQRPSVDVITGLIKANFPARIAFQVASKVDSRTILDAMGADRLLGQGDMLFLPPGSSRLQRLHGAYVSDPEIERITRFICEQGGAPVFDMDLLNDPTGDSDGQPAASSGDDADPMYDLAVQTVMESARASTSYVQRRLQVGYNRAARMMEMMEREGVVSAPDHRGNREILVRSMDE